MDKAVNIALLPIANPDESGWQIQGRKRRNSRERNGKRTDMGSLSDMVTFEKIRLHKPESTAPKSMLSNNPFLVLANIGEDDYQKPYSKRQCETVPVIRTLECPLYDETTRSSAFNFVDFEVGSHKVQIEETVANDKLDIAQDSAQASNQDSANDSAQTPVLNLKKVETPVELSATPEPDAFDAGWQVQGRKRRNRRIRPTENSVVTASESALKIPVVKPSFILNPFQLLSEIGDDDFQKPRPKRQRKKECITAALLESSKVDVVPILFSPAGLMEDLAEDNRNKATQCSTEKLLTTEILTTPLEENSSKDSAEKLSVITVDTTCDNNIDEKQARVSEPYQASGLPLDMSRKKNTATIHDDFDLSRLRRHLKHKRQTRSIPVSVSVKNDCYMPTFAPAYTCQFNSETTEQNEGWQVQRKRLLRGSRLLVNHSLHSSRAPSSTLGPVEKVSLLDSYGGMEPIPENIVILYKRKRTDGL
ncbi:hypothetical protein METBIDRAFT_115731 [Metschnikowia bicuspidata var. bicuspidata NRRL YB-4993]|uniref:Uncharacterized protein n=1 Tax=Metschnikowia bicuspidata var. bicuspidata NRRL YB-4993 TaxID=869754 RepID=A0A1A0HJC0_9ASCO|nr:hypothetical protein METBIDRAFT_115731 [Metschnikowia bicuspidata var. bicuspidata NRRL YB-4993]OBA23982.1 hypothetical protein METBIDRAFT_115731 [Metschnikowia bicuspidata var. bicuspidata NRRL YB-4993]